MRYFSYVWTKNIIVASHLNCLAKAVVIRGHNVSLYGDILRIIPKLSLLPLLIWCSVKCLNIYGKYEIQMYTWVYFPPPLYPYLGENLYRRQDFYLQGMIIDFVWEDNSTATSIIQMYRVANYHSPQNSLIFPWHFTVFHTLWQIKKSFLFFT